MSKLMKIFAPKKKKRELLQCYDIKTEIGRGASSVVYEAVSLETGGHVAVKTISKSNLKQDLKKLYREVEIMSSLRHPNIIRLIEVFESPNEIHLIMDLVKGGELFDKIISRGQYCEADAAILVAQILSAVGYMHSNGVCHRDLKPENLLCAEDDDLYIRIADFGLSKAYGSEDMITICGTPDYVAPEVLECKPYTEAVDMWSVGVITYTLLCGFTPFYGDSHRELFQKILALEYDFPDPEWSAISPEAKDFIRGLLVIEPQRPTAAQALLHPWVTQNLQLRPLPSLASAQRNLASKGGRRRGAAGAAGPIISPRAMFNPPSPLLPLAAPSATAPQQQQQQQQPPPLQPHHQPHQPNPHPATEPVVPRKDKQHKRKHHHKSPRQAEPPPPYSPFAAATSPSPQQQEPPSTPPAPQFYQQSLPDPPSVPQMTASTSGRPKRLSM